MVATLVGREVELGAVARLLDGLVEGPAMLALLGEAGIGKSTVWESGVAAAEARGFTVLACRPAAAEVRSTYSGLVDLLAPLDPARLTDLPAPQARALAAALLRDDEDAAPDPRAVAVGTLGVLRAEAAAGPVLVAVDDLHWLDRPTFDVLQYALRRAGGPLALLVSWRVVDRSVPPEALTVPDRSRRCDVSLAPMTVGALHEVVKAHTGAAPTRPQMVRIARISAGNPYFALELARASADALPDTLRAAVRDRVAGLAADDLEALVTIAALGVTTVDQLREALGADVETRLRVAEERRILELTGREIRFAHPLLAEAVYEDAPVTLRRGVHRRLAEVVGDVEARARHLAQGSVTAEPETIAALDEAAELAARRGSPGSAAELLELAISLGADEPDRRVRAASRLLEAGDRARAEAVLAPALAALAPGPERATALRALGRIRYNADDFAASIEAFEQAYREVGDDVALRADVSAEIIFPLSNGGREPDVMPYLEQGVADAEAAGADRALGELLAGLAMHRYLHGEPLDEVMVARALELDDPDRASFPLQWPAMQIAILWVWMGHLPRGHRELVAVRDRCVELGAETDVWLCSTYLVIAALGLGDLETAEAEVQAARDRAAAGDTQLLHGFAHLTAAGLHAWTGRADEARAEASAAHAALSEAGFAPALIVVARFMGGLELSVGNAAGAAEVLGPAALALRDMGIVEPSSIPVLPDAVEAFLAIGQVDDAASMIEILEASGRTPDRAWARATGARGRGLLLAATGELDAAEAAFVDAVAAHQELPLAYEEGRTLLSLGRLRRRRKDRRGAREALVEAVARFEAVGALGWVRTATDELARVSPQHRSGAELTPTEARVAALAASGMTNREVAGALFVSPKTVEANLSRIYRKLGIRSRAELGRWHAAQEAQP